MRRQTRQAPAYKPLIPLGKLLGRIALRYRSAKPEPLHLPSIVLCNHTTNWDPILVAVSFRDALSFVASEHILHWGVFSRIISAIAHPIIRRKATVAAATALQIARTIRAGGHVCIFAEGDRTFNGVTGPFFTATAKLVRMTGAQLVTFRLEGGYFSSPRWSDTLRKGKFYGHEVNRYSPETLKAMSTEEIDACIARDLHEDAYARQRQSPVRYRGKRLAESLETALYFCPRCGGLGTLKSEGNRLHCTCGLQAEYTQTGFLRGMEPPFDTVYGWDAWQREELKRRLDTVVLSDPDAALLQTAEDGSSIQLASGTLRMQKDALSVGEERIPMENISAMSICGRCELVFSTAETSYEIRRETPYNAYKYRTMFELLQQSLPGKTPASPIAG